MRSIEDRLVVVEDLKSEIGNHRLKYRLRMLNDADVDTRTRHHFFAKQSCLRRLRDIDNVSVSSSFSKILKKCQQQSSKASKKQMPPSSIEVLFFFCITIKTTKITMKKIPSRLILILLPQQHRHHLNTVHYEF